MDWDLVTKGEDKGIQGKKSSTTTVVHSPHIHSFIWYIPFSLYKSVLNKRFIKLYFSARALKALSKWLQGINPCLISLGSGSLSLLKIRKVKSASIFSFNSDVINSSGLLQCIIYSKKFLRFSSYFEFITELSLGKKLKSMNLVFKFFNSVLISLIFINSKGIFFNFDSMDSIKFFKFFSSFSIYFNWADFSGMPIVNLNLLFNFQLSFNITFATTLVSKGIIVFLVLSSSPSSLFSNSIFSDWFK